MPSERFLYYARQNLKVVGFQHGNCAILNRVLGRLWVSCDEGNFQCWMSLSRNGAKCNAVHARQPDVAEDKRNVVSLIEDV